MTAKFETLIESLFRCCQDRHLHEVRSLGLQEAELRFLSEFSTNESLTPKDAADRLGVVKSRVTKIYNDLERKGYVSSEVDLEDMRGKRLSLTESGQDKLDEMRAFRTELFKDIFSRIPKHQQDSVLSSLEAVKAAMDETRAFRTECSEDNK